MKIKSHAESHIIELEDGSRWLIFPGDLDLTLNWQPETDLTVVHRCNDITTVCLVSSSDGSRVRVIPEGEPWPVEEAKSILKDG